MARQYQPKRFLRDAPNSLLEEYFKGKHILQRLNFKDLTETKIEPIYDAWLELSDELKKETERDFRQIDFMATEGGTKVIIDEATWHGEDLSEKFSELRDHHERAFWTFLRRPQYWNQAIQFHQADSLPQLHWRKYKSIEKKPARVSPRDIGCFEQAIIDYFHLKEGRGKNCKVDYYRRNDLDYFFAYPEDYAQASIEWVRNEFRRRSHHPAFEVIFVYSQSRGTLDIFMRGGKKQVVELKKIFAETILQTTLEEAVRDERVYDLSALRKRGFQFVYDPKSGIEDVRIRKLRLSSIYGGKEKIIIEADSSKHPDAVYGLLDKMQDPAIISQYDVTQVGLQVFFVPHMTSSRNRSRSFDITHPNSCSLGQDGLDLIIRKMLKDSGIEPKDREGSERN